MKRAVSKTARDASPSRVRIPPLPPLFPAPRVERSFPALAFLIVALLSAAAGAIIEWQAGLRERSLFDEAENELVAAIQDRLDHYVDGLRAARALFAASRRVEPEEFRRFAETLRLHERYPGIQGLGYATVVSRAPFRTSIVYIEPPDRRNRAALGYDMFAEPARRAAMRRSLEIGMAAATDRVVLVQEIDPEKQPGFLIYMPVFENAASTATLTQKWSAIRGWVYAPFRAGDFFEAVGRGLLDYTVADPASPGDGAHLYRNGSPETDRLRGERIVEVRGRRWLLHMGAQGLMPPLQRHLGWLVALSGLLVACVMYRASYTVQRHSQELAHAQEELRLITDSLPVLISYVDGDLRYRFVNKTYETWYGFPKSHFLGTAVGTHLGEEHAARLRGWMSRVLAGEPYRGGDEVRTKQGLRHVEALGIPDRGPQGVRGLFVVVTDVTQQKTAALELERKVAERTVELSKAMRELESFSYTVSHDLRAPLRSIQSFSALVLKRAGALAPEDRDYLERVVAAGRRMSALITDILELSQISRHEMRADAVDLAALAREAAERLAAEWSHKVEFRVPESLPACGDERLLRIAVDNLLSNAWKYTSKTPGAKVELSKEGEAFVVRDNGIGFEPASAEDLFKPFKRLHTREEFEGTGIGLATVERIISRHGGRIWAEGAPGKGAAFKFTLGRIS